MSRTRYFPKRSCGRAGRGVGPFQSEIAQVLVVILAPLLLYPKDTNQSKVLVRLCLIKELPAQLTGGFCGSDSCSEDLPPGAYCLRNAEATSL